jgi:hypothetical protein
MENKLKELDVWPLKKETPKEFNFGTLVKKDKKKKPENHCGVAANSWSVCLLRHGNLKDIVTCYEKIDAGYFPDRWMISVKKQYSLENAIKIACSCKDEINYIHPHSRRLMKKNLDAITNNLLSEIDKIKNIKNFHELFCIILKNKVSGVGELAMYDIGTRIGHYLNIYPDYIYLHASPTTAVKLLGIFEKSKNIGDTKYLYLTRDDLPDDIKYSNLTIMQIEQLLCACEECFKYGK